MRKTLSSFIFIVAFATYVVFRSHISVSSTVIRVSTAPNTVVVTNIPKPVPTRNNKRQITLAPTAKKPSPTHAKTNRHMHSSHIHRGPYVDGIYTGPLADAYYERLRVRVIIKNGMLKKVSFLPFQVYNGTSQAITSYAMPRLRIEALTVQSAKVNNISGATEISNAFKSSISGALLKAS